MNFNYLGLGNKSFPKQKVSSEEKSKPEWYASCCDYVIQLGLTVRSNENIEDKYSILHGNIPEEHYKKVLNPFNAIKDKYKRFPATMRNYDMIKGIIRRYIGEYLRAPRNFLVIANNPEIVTTRESKLREEIQMLIEEAIAAKIQEAFSEHINNGGEPNQFNPKQVIDFEAFAEDFKANYIDENSEQAQELLNYIKNITKDTTLYSRAYFNFVTFGECYTYTDIRGNKFIKECIDIRDAFPIPNDEMFVEDHDMFARRRRLTYQQIIDEFDEYFTDKDREFMEKFYTGYSGETMPTLSFNQYESFYPGICDKFNNKDREHFRSNAIMARDFNNGLIDVWHTVWKGYAKYAIVEYVNEKGFIDIKIENEDYKLNKEAGDISITYEYKPQVYEAVRIGGYYDSIYPYKARPVLFDRDGKLPYNGVMELLPGLGRFSIVDIITPYQLFYNIVSYHREMVIAKNKLNILMIAKSLLGTDEESTIHKMLSTGVLFIDDSNDQGMLRSQQVRMINATVGDYINQLSILLEDIKNSAKEQVDMTAQRYGEIANYAGKATTEEAINRGSMGSVIVEYIMDCVREIDYNRDLDYAKLAFIDGLDTTYRDDKGNQKFISLNVDNFVYNDYGVQAKNSFREQSKLEQVKQLAFSLGQNGDASMAIAAVEGDNIAEIKSIIEKFEEKKQKFEEQSQQMQQQIEQMKQEFELQKIQLKGEEDRKTAELKGLIDKEISLIQADANMVSFDNGIDESVKMEAVTRRDAANAEINHEKLALAKEQQRIDAYNKEEDRKVKMRDIAVKLEIAKNNRNKYDRKLPK